MTIITAAVKSHLNEKMGAHAKRIGLGTLLESIEGSVVLGVSAGTITATELASSAVTAAKLAADAVETAKIKDEAVTTAKLPDDVITTAKIANVQVTAAKLATDSVETAKITALNVTAAKLAANSVETAKILDGNVTEAKIAVPTAANLNVKRCLLGIFDATAGKAVGTFAIACALPSKAIITRVDYEVTTTFTSATDAGTIALTTGQGAGDILEAAAISVGTAFDAAIPKVTKVTGATAAYIKCTAARTISAVVAVEDLTAGVMRVYADYVLSI
jgi:hypothetical protein